MDAFYASVEQRDHPELQGKPVVVGGAGKRGVVAAASYEARKYGVHSAMPSVTAARLCPNLIFVKARFDVYRDVSRQIRAIFENYTDLIEPLSLDEAYLDVTENKKEIPSGTLIAQAIRKDIFAATQLTASAGVSFNKFLAKIASDINKPNGLKVITPDEAIPFLENLPIEKFHGIGKVTARKMKKQGIYKGVDLKKLSELELLRRFGKVGRHYYRIVRAQDNRPVNPNRIRKSIGAERTFSENLTKESEMRERLLPIIERVFEITDERQNFGRTVTLKMKSADFKIITRSKTFSSAVNTLSLLRATVFELLSENLGEMDKVRLLGVSVSNLAKEHSHFGIQLELDFPEEEKPDKS